MRTMLGWGLGGLFAVAIVGGVFHLTRGHEGDVKDALAELSYEIDYREVDGDVVAGRATDGETGLTVDFAVTFGGSGEDAIRTPGGGSQGHYGSGAESYYFNSNGYANFHPGDSPAEVKRRRTMKFAIEFAICEEILDPDGPCV